MEYQCVSCGHRLVDSDLASIRCPKCSYKGLEPVSGMANTSPEATTDSANPPDPNCYDCREGNNHTHPTPDTKALREELLKILNAHTFKDQTAFSPGLLEDLLSNLERLITAQKIAEVQKTTIALEARLDTILSQNKSFDAQELIGKYREERINQLKERG